MLACDCLTDHLVLDIEDNDNCFELLLRLAKGESIEITSSNIDFFEKCARQLDNQELLEKIFKMWHNELLGLSNVLERLRLKKDFHLQCDDEISLIARYFSDLDEEFLYKLDIDDLENVLSHKNVKIKNQNSLFDMIKEMSLKSDNYRSLFRFVDFRCLDREHLRKFFAAVFPDLLCSTVWNSISDYYMQAVTEENGSDERDKNEVPSKQSNSLAKCWGYEHWEFPYWGSTTGWGPRWGFG